MLFELLLCDVACELDEVAVELACELTEDCDVDEATELELACEATELEEADVTLLALAVDVLLETAWLELLALVTDELVAAAEVA